MNKTILNLAVIAGLGLSIPAFAHESGQANEAVVGDGTGHCISDGAGQDVRTSAWSAEMAAVACGRAAAEPVAAEPAPAPVPKAISETTTLSAAALFDFDKDTIKAEARPQLDEIADRVRSLSSVESVSIVGHTDSVGSDAYNEDLSMRRANAVKNYMLDKGVDASVINTSGMGESQPTADNATSEGRAQNRRVEITLKGTAAN
ncbi:MAG TPA: OmpA family protein [Gammaproteobacteria bacterium]